VRLSPNKRGKPVLVLVRGERVPRADDRERLRPWRPRAILTDLPERLHKAAVLLILAIWGTPILVILTSRRLQRMLLAIAIINVSFQIEKHFFLQEDAASLGSLGGLQVSVTNIALTCLCAAWFVGAAASPRRPVPPRRTKSVVLLPASLFLVFYVVSLFAADDVRLALFQVFKVATLYCLFAYVAEAVNSRTDILIIVRALFIGLIMQSGLMLAQARGLVGEIQFYFIRTQAGTFRDGRVMGTLGSPNVAAAYLAMMILLALGLILGDAGRADKCLAGVGLALASISLIFTESRGGWTCLLLGLVTMMIFGRRRIPWKAAGGIAVVLLLLGIPFKDVIVERLHGDDNGAAASRISLSQIALLMIEDHPITGVGANNYALNMMPYAARSGRSGEFRYTVHNTYFLTWAETGIGGIVAFVWLLIAIVRQGIKCWQFHDPLWSPLALGCAAAITGFMFHLSVDIFRTGSAIDLVWLFGGLVTAMSRMNAGRLAVPEPSLVAGGRLVRYDFERSHPVANEGQS
jgi:O-antigen ligase